MSYQLTVHDKTGYLHAVVTGENNLTNVTAYLREASGHCRDRKLKRLLIEERLEGPRLNAMDVFEIVTKGAAQARNSLDVIAFVDVNAEGDLMGLAGNMASAKGFTVRVFTTVMEAEQWLAKG